MFQLIKLSLFDIKYLSNIARIFFMCGKDMAMKYNLHHWNNSKIKSFAIALYCALKNDVYVVTDLTNKVIATFQVKVNDDSLFFEKLAVDPSSSNKGVGTFCLQAIERLAKENGKNKVRMDVYDKSQHAIDLYSHKGYSIIGSERSLKFTNLIMEKRI